MNTDDDDLIGVNLHGNPYFFVRVVSDRKKWLGGALV